MFPRTSYLGLIGLIVSIITSLVGGGVGAASSERPVFVCVVLGAGGGLAEDNLSAYLLAPKGSRDFICLDAGTLLAGIRKALSDGGLVRNDLPADRTLNPEGWVLRQGIKAYLISHPHLDHFAGLVVNSPEDSPKAVYGLPGTLDALRDHVFNWKIWPNFTNEGREPRLDRYRLVRLRPREERPIAGTSMTVEPFPLSHSTGYPSSAFLIRWEESYALYFGDVGADQIEKSEGIETVWRRVAPLVRKRELRAIFLEVSYPDGRPDESLHGHLTTQWMMEELRRLAELVDAEEPGTALRGLTIVVTHVKPDWSTGPTPLERIRVQLRAGNLLGANFVLARQGLRIEF